MEQQASRQDWFDRTAAPFLSRDEQRATSQFVARIRREVPARLVQASLFGSKARRQARPDSDVDVLLVFHWLPWDREPYATHAEDIAEQVARISGIPVTTWSVSLVDLEHGNRTPMLVDALRDSVPLWFEDHPLGPIPFTPEDALRCVDALLARVGEGSVEFRDHLARRKPARASQRARDDLVRLCTAALLLRGITRPRRGEAVRKYLELTGRCCTMHGQDLRILAWAADAFGADGRDDGSPVPPPPGGPIAAAQTIDRLRNATATAALRLMGTRRTIALTTGQDAPYSRGHSPCRSGAV